MIENNSVKSRKQTFGFDLTLNEIKFDLVSNSCFCPVLLFDSSILS